MEGRFLRSTGDRQGRAARAAGFHNLLKRRPGPADLTPSSGDG
jgi:hypothetical protein